MDVIQIFQPYVEELVEQGYPIWYAAADRGLCSYTTLYARASVLAARHDEMTALVRAIHRTQTWVATAEAAELAEAMAPYFPEVPAARRRAICARYQALRIWGRTPVLPREGYDRLLQSMQSAGFVNPGTPYEQAVDNSFAQAAVAALSGKESDQE